MKEKIELLTKISDLQSKELENINAIIKIQQTMIMGLTERVTRLEYDFKSQTRD